MKKGLFLFLLAVPVVLLTGCWAKPQIQPVQTLAELQTEITRISDQLLSGTITPDIAQELFEQLQSKYTELTQTQLLSRMTTLQKIIDQQKDAIVKLGELPSRAKNLGLSLPVRMRMDKIASKQTRVGKEGYDSIQYVYRGPYDYAMAEAMRIASGAKLFVSPEIAQAQALVNQGKSISGLDTSHLTKGIVYTNHALTDTKIDYLINVSVDADGLLTIEASNYQQMKR
ncbi:MAG: hypothetical protein NTX91_02455 [candidate division SR1 bacterium]|nr:hypothetical protein [candidate division SR1 bacterium]